MKFPEYEYIKVVTPLKNGVQGFYICLRILDSPVKPGNDG